MVWYSQYPAFLSMCGLLSAPASVGALVRAFLYILWYSPARPDSLYSCTRRWSASETLLPVCPCGSPLPVPAPVLWGCTPITVRRRMLRICTTMQIAFWSYLLSGSRSKVMLKSSGLNCFRKLNRSCLFSKLVPAADLPYFVVSLWEWTAVRPCVLPWDMVYLEHKRNNRPQGVGR